MIAIRLPALLLLTAWLGAGGAQGGQAAADPGLLPTNRTNFHVFLLMGQSNMSGYGELLPEDTNPVPGVVLLPTKGAMEWKRAAHPLHNRLGSDRFGLGLPFAVEYLKGRTGVVVGLIPVAWGGAGMDQLNKGSPTYADAMAKARFAAGQGVITGVLWQQGESDTVQPSQSDAYEGKLHRLVADLREDLGDHGLPFVAGDLAEFYGTGPEHNAPDRVKRIETVRAALRSLPAKVAHTGFVPSTGCRSIDGHQVHFDRSSYILLGQRYAAVFTGRPNDKGDP